MTEPVQPTLFACWARHRPASRAAVHLALPGDERTLCGVLQGEPAADSAVTCYECRKAAQPVKPTAGLSPEQAVIAAAEAVLDGPPLAHIIVCNDHAHVLTAYNPLLIAVIRQIPGACWRKERREWLIPAALADETARRLVKAGAQVSSEGCGG